MTLEPEEIDLNSDPEWIKVARHAAAIVSAVRDGDLQRSDHLLHNLNWQREEDASAINAWDVLWEMATWVLHFSSEEYRNLNRPWDWDRFLLSFAGDGTVCRRRLKTDPLTPV